MLLSVTAGASAGPVELVGATIYDLSLSPTNAEAGYRLLSTGEEQTRDGVGAAWTTIGTWLLVGAAADYEARFAATGEETSPNIINTWIGLSGGVTFGLLTDAEEDLQTVGTIEVRNATSGSVVASAALSLRAQRSS